jgi:protoporphyrinogen/coproporphyrinogen III oxidase
MAASIGIVGAGITGLTCAFRLKQLGFDVHLYEASDRPGGPIGSGRHEGFLVEYGPHTILERTSALSELIADLGLDARRAEAAPAAKKRYIVRDGRPVALPMGPHQALSTGALSPLARLRVLAEPFIAPFAGPDEESLAQFVSRRLGREVLDYLVDPFVGGTYAGDPAQLSVRHSFPFLADLEADHGSIFAGLLATMRDRRKNKKQDKKAARKKGHAIVSFDEGLGTLVASLASALDGSISTATTVTKLHRVPNGWKVIYKKGRGHSRRVHDAVVVTVPAPNLASMELRDAVGNVIPVDAFAAVPYAPISLVYLGYRRRDVEHPLDGLGMLIPGVENFHILGSLFISSMFPDRAPRDQVSLATFIGGARHPALCDEDDDTLVEIARMDLHRLLGARGEPTMKKVIRYDRAIPQYNIGHGRYIELAKGIEASHPGLYITGNWKDGIAVPALIEAGTNLAKTVAGRMDLTMKSADRAPAAR